MRIRTNFAAVAGLAIAGLVPAAAAAEDFKPENPECIAPSAPGGGWDFICRTTGKFLQEQGLITSTMQVSNMTGAGGGVAYAYVAKDRADDDNLIVAASNGTTSRLAQGAFPGSTPDDVDWLATFGAEYGAIAVDADSEYTDLKSLMDAVVANPSSVAFAGGSAVGGYDHIKPLLLGKAAGVEDVRKVKYVAFSGGGEAMTALLSGAVQAVSGDFSEIRGFVESGDIRVIAVLAPERLTGFDDLPTAKEQGYDVLGANWRGLYMPKNASDEAKAFWSDAIRQMAESAEFQQYLIDAAIEPFNNFGEDADKFVAENIQQITEISKEIGIIQ
ncbi:tripartite tricarboxylate transporter substrate binding protein [Paracoccus sp. M683]|uniref:Bug family tripartite tricarboxylate transporter substrate binding protein n=1 Tax=Paracoccus sp. M683 TaxID=2594268 RepID=UPI00117EACDC|nr:tripartite tricarboxylate transporter substrate-binding protein [Paracoccus sp. M683]TRW99136.1 tripartite tricarboxylate transporter substrate binding protein [Paracoccus sp. M683]